MDKADVDAVDTRAEATIHQKKSVVTG